MYEDRDITSFKAPNEAPTLASDQMRGYCGLLLVPPFDVEQEEAASFITQIKTSRIECKRIHYLYELCKSVETCKKGRSMIAQVDISLLREITDNEIQLLEAIPSYCIDMPFATASQPWAALAVRSSLAHVNYDQYLTSVTKVHKLTQSRMVEPESESVEMISSTVDRNTPDFGIQATSAPDPVSDPEEEYDVD